MNGNGKYFNRDIFILFYQTFYGMEAYADCPLFQPGD